MGQSALWIRIFVIFSVLMVPLTAYGDWPTLGANRERTSHVQDEIRGDLGPVWYRPIEPFINYKTQVIIADNKLFISTARGLYCLHPDTGAKLWVYPTQAPLGHSPTFYNGKLYVGSYDRTIHCVDAQTGQACSGWTPHVALAGFETNPLVVNGRVFAGNRDGYFYCLDANTGQLVWRYKTGAAIRNSAAMDSQGILYFASEDLHAYALTQAGGLVWKSDKLLGDSFSSYWPVVYRNWVIFSGSMGYFYTPPYGDGVQLPWDDGSDIQRDISSSTGSEPGDWAPETVTMDSTPILNHYKNKPYRRRVFMLNRSNGQEYTFNGNYAPFTFSGVTQSGPKYPPVVGPDDVIYTDILIKAFYNSNGYWTPTGALVGWKVGTPILSRVMEWGKTEQASDEPFSFSVGGNLVYFMLCCDREAGAFDLTIPFGQPNRWWSYWGYSGRFNLLPNYQPQYGLPPEDEQSDWGNGWEYFQAPKGIYGKHGLQNPWVPYNGKLFHIMGNSIVAMAPGGRAAGPLPELTTEPAPDISRLPALSDLRLRLEEEIQKMIDAGHLKPGLFKSNVGDFTLSGNGDSDMDQGIYYFSNPGDTIQTLLRSLPHLTPSSQVALKAYIQKEMNDFPIDRYAYTGHVEGTARQAAAIPPDYQSFFDAMPKSQNVYNNIPWNFPMPAFYAAWKYATVWPAEAERLYTNMKEKLTIPCSIPNDELLSSVQMINAYLAGYKGFLELEKMTGRAPSSNVQNEYNRLLILRMNNLTLDLPFNGKLGMDNWHYRNFINARHFLYLVPEVAEDLASNGRQEVEAMVNEINEVTPYWFVEGYDATHGEGSHQQLYDVATFNAYHMILKKPYSELVRYLDAPVFERGDLLYINNLVSILEAAGTDRPAPPENLRVIP